MLSEERFIINERMDELYLMYGDGTISSDELHSEITKLQQQDEVLRLKMEESYGF